MNTAGLPIPLRVSYEVLSIGTTLLVAETSHNPLLSNASLLLSNLLESAESGVNAISQATDALTSPTIGPHRYSVTGLAGRLFDLALAENGLKISADFLKQSSSLATQLPMLLRESISPKR
jgi:hypothetical protein